MGFFDSIKKNAQRQISYIKDPGGSIERLRKDPRGEAQRFMRESPGSVLRNAAPYLDRPDKTPEAGENPTVSALRNRLFGEASDFQQGLGGMQQSASDQIQREGDLALESGIKGTKQNFNRRGLLYSGLREAGEQDVKGKVASTMSQQKAQSNKELSDMARSKWEKVAQVGLQGYQESVNREAEIAGINLQNQVARAQMMQSLGQHGGYLAGNYYGNRQQQPMPQQNYSASYGSGYGNTSPMANGANFGQRGA